MMESNDSAQTLAEVTAALEAHRAQVDHCVSEMLQVVQAVADGRFDTYCTSLGLDDGAMGALGLGINIMVSDTAEAMRMAKNEQRRVELILQSVPDPVFTVDHEMCITFMSPATEELTGVSLREARGKPCSRLFHSGLCDLGCPLKEATANGEALQSQEIKLQVRGDVEVDALISVGALTNEAGKLSGGVAIIRDITEQKQRERERQELQQQIIAAQARSIEELSTPIIPIMNRIIVMPLIGNIDTHRAKNLMRNLLAGITQNRAKVVIIDVTGVAIVDTAVASHLFKTIRAAQLKGAETILTGISDPVAETIVELGIDLGEIETLADLQSGLLQALGRLGYELVQTTAESR